MTTTMNKDRNRVTLTPTIAWAAGIDAANANMRKAGRKRWSIEDRNIAAVTTNRLFRAMGYPIPASECEL